MNLQHIKKKLAKVNRFFSYLESNEEQLAQLDKDAFLASIRQLYEACVVAEVQQETAAVQKPVEVKEKTTNEPVSEGPQFVFVQQDSSPKEVSKPKEQPKKISKNQAEVLIDSVNETPVDKDEKSAKPALLTDAKLVSKVESFKEEYEELFQFKAATDLSQKLSETPISDLSKALGLNQKFLYINELFAGDVAQFQQSVKLFNEANDFSLARVHIEKDLVERYEWLNKQKKKIAKDFVKLVRRRYL